MSVPKVEDGLTTIEDAIQVWVTKGSGLASSNVIWSDQQGPRPQAPYVSMKILQEDGRGLDWYDTENNPLSFAPKTIVSVNTGADTVHVPAYGLATGDGPVQVTTTGTLPAPLTVVTDYWTISAGVDDLKFATSLANANLGVAVDLTTSGTGTNQIVSTANTLRRGAEILNIARGPRTLTLSLQAFAVDATGAATARALLGRVLNSTSLPSIFDALVAAGVGVADWTRVQSTGGILNTVRFEPRAMVTVTIHVAMEISETGTFVERITAHGPDGDLPTIVRG